MPEHVYHTDIHSVVELIQMLIQFWCIDQHIIDTAGIKVFEHDFV